MIPVIWLKETKQSGGYLLTAAKCCYKEDVIETVARGGHQVSLALVLLWADVGQDG